MAIAENVYMLNSQEKKNRILRNCLNYQCHGGQIAQLWEFRVKGIL